MKDVKFIRLSKENFELVSSINIDYEKISKNNLKEFIANKDNYCFIGMYGE